MKIECIWQGPAMLGESPLWHASEKKLYWVDIPGKQLHQWDPKTKHHQQWTMPAMITCVAPRQHGGLIAALAKSIVTIDTQNGEVKKLPGLDNIIRDQPHVRFNDGKCDRQGRFWLGSMHSDDGEHIGKLYCLNSEHQLTVMQQGLHIANGLGWSPDNTVFYHTDLPHIYRYDFDAVTGEITNREIFITVATQHGVPDGLTVDAKGYVWSCHWNGNRITRYAPDGSIDRVITMPIQRPTSCTFGGDKLDILYVTSAARDVMEQQTLPQPNGAVYAISDLGVTGLFEPAFIEHSDL